MNTNISNKRISSHTAQAIAVIAVSAALSLFFLGTHAEERNEPLKPAETFAPGATLPDLEQAFWTCDYAGTTSSVDSGTAMACSAITEELKNRNFNGDFEAMLVWWRASKPKQHQALAAATRERSHTAHVAAQ